MEILRVYNIIITVLFMLVFSAMPKHKKEDWFLLFGFLLPYLVYFLFA